MNRIGWKIPARRAMGVEGMFRRGLAIFLALFVGLSLGFSPSFAATELALDDGTMEAHNNDGVGNPYLALNYFLIKAGDFPVKLTGVRLMFPQANNLDTDDTFDVYVYEDKDHDGNPVTGYEGPVATLKGIHPQFTDGQRWSYYDLTEAVTFEGPGAIMIGVVNRSHPANVGEDTNDWKGYSYLGTYNPPGAGDPPAIPADKVWLVLDDKVTNSGNWMIRGVVGGEDSDSSSGCSAFILNPLFLLLLAPLGLLLNKSR